MLCFVTIHWSQSCGSKVNGAPNHLIRELCVPPPLLRRRCWCCPTVSSPMRQ